MTLGPIEIPKYFDFFFVFSRRYRNRNWLRIVYNAAESICNTWFGKTYSLSRYTYCITKCAQKCTTKKVRQIAHGGWHFSRNFAFPSPLRQTQNHRGKEYRAIYIFHKKEQKKTFFLQIGEFGYQKTKNFMFFQNPKTILKKRKSNNKKNILLCTFSILSSA